MATITNYNIVVTQHRFNCVICGQTVHKFEVCLQDKNKRLFCIDHLPERKLTKK